MSFVRSHRRIQPESFSNNKELINKILSFDKIVVVGFPKTGKTSISKKIFNNREIVHTDDFIDKCNWSLAPKVIIESVADKEIFIIEGIQGFRVLRKGNRENIFKADCVIFLKPKFLSLPEHISMRKTLTKIWEDFLKEHKYSFCYFKVSEDDFS